MMLVDQNPQTQLWRLGHPTVQTPEAPNDPVAGQEMRFFALQFDAVGVSVPAFSRLGGAPWITERTAAKLADLA